MSSFAETTLIPSVRRQLERTARWVDEGHYDQRTDAYMAALLRRLVPSFAGMSDDEVLSEFLVLRSNLSWLNHLAERVHVTPTTELITRLAAARADVDAVLCALVPSEVAL